MADSEYILEMHHISKSFPGVQALHDVSINLKRGEVLALIGENGAGKSTLMSILMGQQAADSGEIVLEGSPAEIFSPAVALKKGVAMIYQELNPIPYMSIADNIFLNREDRIFNTPFVNRKALNRRAQELLNKYKISHSPETNMCGLSVAECQMIEIIKAVSYHSRVVIMDEPTSSLSNEEADKLFATIRELKADGVGVIYISHRMDEIFDLADRVTILRDGEFIETDEISSVTHEQLIGRMVGRKIDNLFPKVECPIGEVELTVKDFSSQGVFENISFQVHKGEILGLAGLVGAGRSEIVKAIFGLDPHDSGELLLEGKPITIKNTRDAIDQGIAMVSEDRKKYGLVLCRDILENISLAHIEMFRKGAFLNKKSETDQCEELSHHLNIKISSLKQKAGNLSGGNQQKVVLAKWLLKQPKVLILDEPTRGIDVGAKSEIHRMISNLAAAGMAIIMISSELPEILGMSDRVLVIGGGRIRGEFMRSNATQEEILACAIGEN